jgi:hypothetical protein
MATKAAAMAKRTKRAGTSTAKRGKKQKAAAKRATKRAVSKKAKKSAKKAGARRVTKARRAPSKAPSRKRKPIGATAPMIETEIIEVVEEPFPGVVTITEFETERLIVPDSGDEKAGDEKDKG